MQRCIFTFVLCVLCSFLTGLGAQKIICVYRGKALVMFVPSHEFSKKMKGALALYRRPNVQEALNYQRIRYYEALFKKDNRTRAEDLSLRLYCRELKQASLDITTALNVLRELSKQLSTDTCSAQTSEQITTFIKEAEALLTIVDNVYFALTMDRNVRKLSGPNPA